MAAAVRRVAAPYKDIEKQSSLCKGANPCNNPSVSASPSQLPCRGAIIEVESPHPTRMLRNKAVYAKG